MEMKNCKIKVSYIVSMPVAPSIFKQFQKKLQASSLYLNDHNFRRAQNSENFFVVKSGLIYTMSPVNALPK